MRRRAGLCLILVIAFAASAASINLTGTVSNKSGKPISGAVVKLVGQKLADTTDANGAYSITGGNAPANPIPILSSTEKVSLIKGIVLLSLTKPAPVSIEMFDLRGNLLERALDHPASAGDYRFDVMTRPLASNIMLIRVTIGQRASSFHYLSLNDGKRAGTSSIAVSSTGSGGLAKTQAIVDSLKVSASGYMSDDSAISSLQGVVNITLDSITLAKFSFFVTSLKALLEFSGSQNGFGGDLRFGKTGPGAGLLGADSICQCIAEKSMPGSKVKIWRAFLSVSSDANGKQVNAIDRIGKGPWYDRRARLLAPTLADLLNARPANGDAAIQNDLPNEDGIPNHQPDPNQPAVDNHNTITGTGTDGKLYSANRTCQDWTSVSTSITAYGGLSWPRSGGMGGSNWMAGLITTGCKAGVEIIETGGPPPGCVNIGCGGGYGGFYCFALTP
jgi:hypothetical protein